MGEKGLTRELRLDNAITQAGNQTGRICQTRSRRLTDHVEGGAQTLEVTHKSCGELIHPQDLVLPEKSRS